MTLPRNLNASEGDRSWLSAAADGDPASLDRVGRVWREDAEVRKTWHAYHLIGDTLRSAELAQPAARDADFLIGVRARLAKEPVALAPAPTATLAPTRRAASRWAVPAAVAAGFVVVAGVLVVSRGTGPLSGAQDVMAGASSPSGVLNVSTLGSAPRSVAQGTGAVLRDARVDELLRVHQASRGGMVVPGSGLRRVDNVVPAEPVR
jgi:sigma-E factor negative regulatory protein RseA